MTCHPSHPLGHTTPSTGSSILLGHEGHGPLSAQPCGHSLLPHPHGERAWPNKTQPHPAWPPSPHLWTRAGGGGKSCPSPVQRHASGVGHARASPGAWVLCRVECVVSPDQATFVQAPLRSLALLAGTICHSSSGLASTCPALTKPAQVSAQCNAWSLQMVPGPRVKA